MCVVAKPALPPTPATHKIDEKILVCNDHFYGVYVYGLKEEHSLNVVTLET